MQYLILYSLLIRPVVVYIIMSNTSCIIINENEADDARELLAIHRALDSPTELSNNSPFANLLASIKELGIGLLAEASKDAK